MTCTLSWRPVHDMPILTHRSAAAVLSYPSLGVGPIAVWLWQRRNEPRLLVVMEMLWLPLLLVTQVIAPLQNQMAERYLWWRVITRCMASNAQSRRAFASRGEQPGSP